MILPIVFWRKWLTITFTFVAVWSSIQAQDGPNQVTIQSLESLRSPANQVFQFMESGTCRWPDSSQTQATLHLWIPETCRRLRGLLVLCTNVPEQMLVGHADIRRVCAAHDLGIVWAVPSFMNFRKSTTRDGRTLNMATEYQVSVGFLQQLLNGLAKTSGYDEVATVPWLPIGESGHLLMVDALLEHSPHRCMAGIYLKNNHLPPHNRQVPTLVIFGTAQEWGQDKEDIRTRWNNVEQAYQRIRSERRQHPQWPLSYIIDGTSGHFDCSERLTRYIARYIAGMVTARLPRNNRQALRPLKTGNGFLADLPVPGYEDRAVERVARADTTGLAAPWYVSNELAIEAQAIARINWRAATQLPAFADETGMVTPFVFNGIMKLPAPVMADDGVTFRLKGIMLNKLPANFIGAGEPLAAVPTVPALEWVCGSYKPVGNNTFCIALDRTWPYTPNYVGIRQLGNDRLRAIFQPGSLILARNEAGIVQRITVEKIANITVGTPFLTLRASSDSGMPVYWFVVSGPAIVNDSQLILTKIPPRSKFPVAITVAAWQWGRNTQPKVKTAEMVKQIFWVTK